MPCDTPPPVPELDDVEEVNEIEEVVPDAVYDLLEEYGMDILAHDNSFLTFDGHKGAVFCCNFDNSGTFVVSGGQDDTAYVWNANNCNVKFQCTGHKDSVISASFSPDNKYVATADMHGLIQVWDSDNGSSVWDFDLKEEVMWMEWLHSSNILIAGTTDGNCWKWNIPDGDTVVLPSRGFGITTGCISFDDERIILGYSDGSVVFYNLKTNSVLGTVDSSQPEHSVTVMKYRSDGAMILVGYLSGSARLIRTSDYKVIWSIECCDNTHDHEYVSVESVSFSFNPSLIAIGTSCGILTVWDISTQTKRFILDFEAAIVKIICEGTCPVLYAALANGNVQVLDVRTGSYLKVLGGHISPILDFAISRDQSLIVTSSDDFTCKIFNREPLEITP